MSLQSALSSRLTSGLQDGQINKDSKSYTTMRLSVIHSASYMTTHPVTESKWDLQPQNSSTSPDCPAAAPERHPSGLKSATPESHSVTKLYLRIRWGAHRGGG